MTMVNNRLLWIGLLACLPLWACGEEKEETGTPEADTDTDADADTDSDTDTDPSMWDGCPESSAYVGDTSWQATMEVAASAEFCGGFNETRTLEQELAAKALMKAMPGSYGLPKDEGTFDLALPLCVLRVDEASSPAMDGTGSTTVTQSSWGGTTYTYLTGEQPMAASDGSNWNLGHTLILVGDEGAVPTTLALNADLTDAVTGAGAEFTLYTEGSSNFDLTTTIFTPCQSSDWDLHTHGVEFDGGNITLEIELGESLMATAPGYFVKASGTLDGTAFEQTDYFKLIYRPGHHHFDRHFAVIFDTPIGDACALRIENVDPWEGDPTAVVSTADCSLTQLETRATTAETYQVGR